MFKTYTEFSEFVNYIYNEGILEVIDNCINKTIPKMLYRIEILEEEKKILLYVPNNLIETLEVALTGRKRKNQTEKLSFSLSPDLYVLDNLDNLVVDILAIEE